MTKKSYIGNNITTPDFTWKTIPNDKQKLKTRIDASVSNINRQPVEGLTDCDSSSDSLPDNVLANYTSENEISSDSDIDFTKEFSKGMLDESMEVGSVKSEPMSDEDERGKNKSRNIAGKKMRKNSDSNKEHQKSPAHQKKLKPKIQPCTTEEYNMFLKRERSMNNTSLNIGENENDVTYNDKNYSEIKSSLEESHTEKRKKKKKKKSESHDESEQHRNKKSSKKINRDSINNCDEDSEDEGAFNTSPRKSNTYSEPSTERKIKKKKNQESGGSTNDAYKEKNDHEIKLQSESIEKKSKKKKKKISESLDESEQNINNQSSNKIDKHSLLINDEGSEDDMIIDSTPVIQNKLNSKMSTERKTKKKKKYSELLDESEINDGTELSQRETSIGKTKKKKRKNSEQYDEPAQYKKKISPLKVVKRSITDDSDDSEEEADMMTKKSKFDDHQVKLLQSNNFYKNSSESDEALDTEDKAFNRLSSNTLKSNKNEGSPKIKNMARSQNKVLNKSENESSDENPQYSFQLNSSYDHNKNREHVNNSQISPALRTIKSGHEKIVSSKVPANSGTKKTSLKQSRDSLKHIANSTVLDMTNFELELPNMSIPNVSVIKDIKSSAKKSTLTENRIENTLAEDYIAKNDNLQYKKFTSTLFEDIGDDDEIFLVQCPKSIDPNLLIDQNIFDSSFHYNDSDYKFTTVKNCAENVSFLFPEKTSTVIKTMPLVGHIIIETDLKPTTPRKVKKSKQKEVEFPEDLQIRHPIFGRNYEKKINIPEHVLSEMIAKKSKKHKKNKRSKSCSRAEIGDFNGITANNQNMHSETDKNEHIPKKKKKKKSINQEKDHLWNSNDDIARNLFVDA